MAAQSRRKRRGRERRALPPQSRDFLLIVIAGLTAAGYALAGGPLPPPLAP